MSVDITTQRTGETTDQGKSGDITAQHRSGTELSSPAVERCDRTEVTATQQHSLKQVTCTPRGPEPKDESA